MIHGFGRGPREPRDEPGERAVRPAKRPPAAAVIALWAALVAACATVPPPQAPPLTAAREGGEDAAKTRSDAAPAPAPPTPPAELPRGGRTLFPDYRLVGFCGTPGAPELGSLQGNLTARAKTLEAQAAKYGDDRKLLPVFELIAVVVQSGAGHDGKYRRRVDDGVVDYYLRTARASKALLLLNIQPGQSDFVTEVKSFESYLRQPDVGIALDPEWAMKPKQTPGRFYGQTNGETINDVAVYLSSLVQQGNLPEKALVFHQVNRLVLKDEIEMKPIPGVAFIKSVDGLGPMHSKIETYDYLMITMKAGVHPGFKLFFDEDTRMPGSQLMTPKQVLALTPRPEYVMYE